MYCRKCQEEKEESEFTSKRGNVRVLCNPCERAGYKRRNYKRGDKRKEEAKNWKEKNPDYFKTYRKENHKERCEYNKKWQTNNRERYLLRRKRSKIQEKQRNPIAYSILSRITSSFTRILKVKKSRTCLYYTGCSSVEDFITKLSEKTENPNWIQDKWQIDHIWQLNWFKDALGESEEAYLVISNHINLRPLSASSNSMRSPLDFSPLKREDFCIYERFMNEEIRLAALFYFENLASFSGNQINKGSNEENRILGYMESIGKLPNFYTGLTSYKKQVI